MIVSRPRRFLICLAVVALLGLSLGPVGQVQVAHASGLTWDEVLATYEDPALTSVQRDEYLKGLKDQRVEGWQGTVVDVSSFLGSYSAVVDMTGNEESDIHLSIRKEDATRLNKGATVTFSGKIWDVDSLFGFSLWIRDVTFGATPAATVATTAPAKKGAAPTAAPAAASQKAVSVKVKTNGNLRAGPGTTFAIAGTVKAGQSIQITGRTKANDWFVTPDNKWINKVLLTAIPTVPEAANIPAAPKAPAAKAPAATKAPAAAPAAAPKAATFGAGIKIVGKDIAAGTYRTRGGNSCYWERLKGFGGSLEEIAANDLAVGPVVVTITPEDKGFSSQRCGTWTADLGPITASPTAPFAQGTFIVNTDIAPGTWQSSGGAGCYWERLSGFRGILDEIIANNLADGPAVVTIAPTDAGFSSNSCGAWTKID